jgi:predicted kinase
MSEQKVQNIIVLKGLPASGKSTWAEEYMKSNPYTLRVSRDMIRNMLKLNFPHGSFLEELVTDIEDISIKNSLKKGYSVIVDATNFRGYERFISLMPVESDINIMLIEFDTPLEECILRDSKRSSPVGKDVIERMYKKYIKYEK